MTWELPAAPGSWGHAVPAAAPSAALVLDEEMLFSHHTELGLAQEGSAGSHRPAVTGSSLSSVGFFPSEKH